MEHTSNYNLSQWAGEDRIQREDFNADNAKIEAAILGANEAAAAAAASGLKIKTGTFSGTGSTGTRTYSLGFKPKLLFLRTDNINASYTHDRGVVATENMCVTYISGGNCSMTTPGNPCTLTEDGFSLVLNSTPDRGLNNSGSTLYYWALY